MKKITGPIDDLTVIRQAITFGNMKDVSDVGAVCKRLRVLPPGAPYWINGRGEVFQAPRKKRNFAAVVDKAHTAMRGVLAAIYKKQMPTVGQPARIAEKDLWRMSVDKDGERVHERVPNRRAEIDFSSFPSPYWFRAQGYEPRRSGKGVRPQLISEDEYIIPTLDGLLAASAAVLYRYRHRIHVRRCPFCPTYFTLPGKKQKTCGKDPCRKEHKREKNRKSSADKRERERKLLDGNRK